MQTKTIYVDANATYPVCENHYESVIETLKRVDGNPSSIHATGRVAKIALEDARESLAKVLGSRTTEVIFTSGATESNNLVIHGIVLRDQKKLPHIVVLGTEHSSVIEPAKLLEQRGFCELSVVPVDHLGRVDLQEVKDSLKTNTVFLGVMHANNETGVIHPIRDVVNAAHDFDPRVHIHVDAVQTLGKKNLQELTKLPLHSIALSAHKIGGFKGVGALWLKSGSSCSQWAAGGGQERTRRPGTENLPGIISFGMRCNDLNHELSSRVDKMRILKESFLSELKQIAGIGIHGDILDDPKHEKSLPNTVNFHVEGVLGDDVLLNFDLAGIHASSGSACSSGTARPSSVLLAMGYEEHIALNSVRVSFWHGNELHDIPYIAGVLKTTIKRVRGYVE